MRSFALMNQARHTRRLARLLPGLILLLALIPEAAAPRAAEAADPTFGFPVTLPNSNGTASSVASGDLNRDGSDDIVLGNLFDLNTLGPSPSQVYLNPGTGDFSAAAPTTLPQSGRFTAGVAIGDLDGVNGPDIVLGNLYNPTNPGAPQNSQVYLNPGNGNFSSVTPATLNFGSLATSVAIGDLNNDTRPDIVLGKAAGPSLVYINPVGSNFATVVPTPMGGSGLGTYGVALGNFDGANGPDIVLANFTAQAQTSQVYLNPGSGNFSAVPPTTLRASGPNAYSVSVGDVDGVSGPDIVLGNTNQPSQVYLNPGTGNFSNVTPAPIGGSGSNTLSVKLGDLNGDGALDLFSANNIRNAQVFLNNGRGVFATPSEIPASFNGAQGAVLSDLNRDGLPDVVLANIGNPSQVFLNTRVSASVEPSFRFPTQLPGTGRSTYGVAPGDLNGDGALDIVLGNNGQRSQVLLNRNDGTGTFAQPLDLDPSGPARRTFNVAVGDLNGDGALDIVLGNSGQSVNGQFVPQPSQIFLNDGRGAFGAPRELPGSGRPTRSIALADLNADGALDIVLGNNVDPSNPQNTYLSQVYLNPGDGDFSGVAPTDLPDSGRTTLSVVAADLNGDQRPDIVLGNYFVQNGLVIVAYF
ncbi:MAG TPA: VCBS repeat-containing protein, partial [Roseiflexaceae bacterium]|nr:VCBS repeat-containing protein [Roseiflexaceae bacterium]